MIPEFERLVAAIIEKNISTENMQWLNQQATLVKHEENAAKLYLAFVYIPRKTGHNIVKISDADEQQLTSLVPGFSLKGWTIDRLCRLWLLLQIPSTNQDDYSKKIDALFRNADMNEQTALYSSLYFFAYPNLWQHRCAEGIRCNIGTVLEAIMYHNPYPAKYLEEKAWNQLVLKAFFTEKDINSIIGIDDRSNRELAHTLVDYSNERWAAHRQVNPQLWRMVSKFITDTSLPHFQRLLQSDNEKEQQAAALSLDKSDYQPARDLLKEHPHLVQQLQKYTLSWNNI